MRAFAVLVVLLCVGPALLSGAGANHSLYGLNVLAPPASYHSDPAPTRTETGSAIVLRKELTGYPNYGRDGAADVVYPGEVGRWRFLPAQGIESMWGRTVSVTLWLAADAGGMEVEVRFTGNHVSAYHERVPPGTPAGEPFTDWWARTYDVYATPGAPVEVVVATHGGGWVAVDALELALAKGSVGPVVDDSGAWALWMAESVLRGVVNDPLPEYPKGTAQRLEEDLEEPLPPPGWEPRAPALPAFPSSAVVCHEPERSAVGWDVFDHLYHTAASFAASAVPCVGVLGVKQAVLPEGGRPCLLLTGGLVDCAREKHVDGDAAGVAMAMGGLCRLLVSGNVDCDGAAPDYHGGDAVSLTGSATHWCIVTTARVGHCKGSGSVPWALGDFGAGDVTRAVAGDGVTCFSSERVGDDRVDCRWWHGEPWIRGTSNAIDSLAVSTQEACYVTGQGGHCYGPRGEGSPRGGSGVVAVYGAGSSMCTLHVTGNAQCDGLLLDAGGEAVSVALGGGTYCAIKRSGSVDCWGGPQFRYVALTPPI